MQAELWIKSHRSWKARFRETMATGECWNIAQIKAVDACELGTFLAGFKAPPELLPAYLACLQAHARFHVEAGRVAEEINLGNYPRAEEMMVFDSEYAVASRELQIRLVALANQIAAPADIAAAYLREAFASS